MQEELGLVDAREDADSAAGLMQQPIFYDNNATQVANGRLNEENQRSKERG